jgi:hypothetical protein
MYDGASHSLFAVEEFLNVFLEQWIGQVELVIAVI